MNSLFKGIGDGRRFILGIADTTPPDADFERLVRIGHMAAERGRLPLAAGSFNPVSPVAAEAVPTREAPEPPRAADARFGGVRQAVIHGDEGVLLSEVRNLVEAGIPAKEIIDLGMVAAMDTLNQGFKDGTVFIPEVLASARAMNAAVLLLEPHLSETDRRSGGKVLIGTVRGDLHDIGKNMVAIMLRGVGFNVVDLGINVAVDAFVQRVQHERPQVLALSALLTTTMPEMRKVIAALDEAGLRAEVKVIVGGAPVNRNFANDIRADGYARDAAEAVELVRRLVD
jgi:corrinoid protein of di/trimethylamine methyltransferase